VGGSAVIVGGIGVSVGGADCGGWQACKRNKRVNSAETNQWRFFIFSPNQSTVYYNILPRLDKYYLLWILVRVEITFESTIVSMSKQQFPEPTVGIFIFNQNGELLLLESHKWPGAYVVPGGHVELGERLEETAIREAKEETGLDIYDLEFINFQQFIYDPAFWKQRHFIFFDFAAKTDSLDVMLNDEAQAYGWYKLEDALELQVDSYTRTSIETYLKKRDRGDF